MQVQSANDIVAKIDADPEFRAAVMENPASAIAKVAAPMPLLTDNWIYRIVVISLGLVILTIIIGQVILMTVAEKYFSEGFIALASAAVGALAGLLAPSPGKG